jgi:prepilin-type N-terminal cleavage/methylation domain-containing protein
MKNRKGITLLELVVVMAIVALGAAFVAPNIGAWMPNYRLKSATRDIASAMRTAQIQAVTNNARHRVTFPSTESYTLERDSGGIWVPDPKWVDQDGNPIRLPSGVQFSSITFAGSAVVFNPNSTAQSGTATLRNSKGSVKRVRVFSTTGRIRIDD